MHTYTGVHKYTNDFSMSCLLNVSGTFVERLWNVIVVTAAAVVFAFALHFPTCFTISIAFCLGVCIGVAFWGAFVGRHLHCGN